MQTHPVSVGWHNHGHPRLGAGVDGRYVVRIAVGRTVGAGDGVTGSSGVIGSPVKVNRGGLVRVWELPGPEPSPQVRVGGRGRGVRVALVPVPGSSCDGEGVWDGGSVGSGGRVPVGFVGSGPGAGAVAVADALDEESEGFAVAEVAVDAGGMAVGDGLAGDV